jgi:hypothetical protein
MGLDDQFPLRHSENRAKFAEFVAFAYERFAAFEESDGWGTVVTKCGFRRGVGEVVIDASERHSKVSRPLH